MEEKKFNKTYREFAARIFRYVYFKVSDYDTAADVTADTFTRFWKILRKEDIGKTKAFLFSIANGIIIDYYRKKSNQKKVSLTTVDERLLGFTDNNEDALGQKQEIESLLQKLKKLKKEYQDIVLLHYVEELTITEISFILRKKENNTRVILHRALQALKKLV